MKGTLGGQSGGENLEEGPPKSAFGGGNEVTREVCGVSRGPEAGMAGATLVKCSATLGWPQAVHLPALPSQKAGWLEHTASLELGTM